MFKATKLIAEAMDSHGLKYTVREEDDMSMIQIYMNNDTGSEEVYFFISNDDENDVLIHSGVIAHIPEEKTDAAPELMNELNRYYRFMRFVLDDDNDVTVQIDIPQETPDEDLGKVAIEMLLRLNQEHDNVYARVMKFIWG